MADKTPASPRLRILLGEAIALGPGKAALLAAIRKSGSISAAARSMGMSYRRAWTLVDEMNRAFRAPLVVSATGGRRGGGAAVTALGSDVLERYQRMENLARHTLAAEIAAFRRLLRASADPGED
ncbi:MAG: LysR family transcriptional regulator [Rhodospirillales bacterium]|nr:LysR family transcriptional regulator [Rhodospirillales bacterium]